MQKVYYDAVNNKEVVDVSGVKDEAQIKSDFGLDVATQVLEIDPALNEAHEIVAGVLQKFDAAQRAADAQAAAQAARAAKRTAMLAKLGPGWTEQDLDDLSDAIN